MVLRTGLTALTDLDIVLPDALVCFVFSFPEKELLDSLPFTKQCSEEEAELLRFLYENKLKKVSGANIMYSTPR